MILTPTLSLTTPYCYYTALYRTYIHVLCIHTVCMSRHHYYVVYKLTDLKSNFPLTMSFPETTCGGTESMDGGAGWLVAMAAGGPPGWTPMVGGVCVVPTRGAYTHTHTHTHTHSECNHTEDTDTFYTHVLCMHISSRAETLTHCTC